MRKGSFCLSCSRIMSLFNIKLLIQQNRNQGSKESLTFWLYRKIKAISFYLYTPFIILTKGVIQEKSPFGIESEFFFSLDERLGVHSPFNCLIGLVQNVSFTIWILYLKGMYNNKKSVYRSVRPMFYWIYHDCITSYIEF